MDPTSGEVESFVKLLDSGFNHPQWAKGHGGEWANAMHRYTHPNRTDIDAMEGVVSKFLKLTNNSDAEYHGKRTEWFAQVGECREFFPTRIEALAAAASFRQLGGEKKKKQ